MTYQTAKRLLHHKPLEEMTLIQLQRFKVRVVDAARQSEAEYGYAEAVDNGFFTIVASDGTPAAFVPADLWLTHNLWYLYNQCVKLEKIMLRFKSDAKFQEYRKTHDLQLSND